VYTAYYERVSNCSIVHRDVKGGNALLTTSGIVKLADSL
jgi:serine/threonine protein kinase